MPCRSLRSLLLALALACAAALAWPLLAQSAELPPATPAALPAGSIGWDTLTDEQRQALLPLAGLWPTLRPERQRKWIALVRNFGRMTPGKQSTLQHRMTRWTKLTDAQRVQARLNFGEAHRLPAAERRAKWEAYQALPAEERARLAKARPKPPVSAAPALRPAPPNRIAHMLSKRNGMSTVASVNHNALPPQQPASTPRSSNPGNGS